MSPIPSGWRIEAVARCVYLEVPASGADGVLQLTLAEAVSAGIALIRAAEVVWSLDQVAGDLAAASARARQIEWLKTVGLEQMSDTFGLEFAEAHRQSALAAASSSAAEDQAWVDDICDFNDDAACDLESEAGDQE